MHVDIAARLPFDLLRQDIMLTRYLLHGESKCPDFPNITSVNICGGTVRHSLTYAVAKTGANTCLSYHSVTRHNAM